MDRKELLQATLAGENTDRVCCGFWYHFDEEHKFGKKSFEAHMQFCESINPDILKVMNEHTFIIKEKINEPEDWKKVTRLPFEDTGYEDYLEEFKALKKALPKDLPLFVTIHGVLVSAYHATEGVGNFKNVENMVSRHLRQDPDAVDHGLKIIAQTLTELSEKLIDAGADGIFYAALGGEEYRFSEDLFLNHVKPFDKMVIDGIKAHGGMSILHICKDKIRLMTDLAIYEKRHEEDVFKINKYYKADYIFWNLLLAFLRFTVFAVIVLAINMVIRPDVYFYNINLNGIAAMLRQVLAYYLIGLIIYLVISYNVYLSRYKKARKGMLFYATKLKRLARRYNYSGREIKR